MRDEVKDSSAELQRGGAVVTGSKTTAAAEFPCQKYDGKRIINISHLPADLVLQEVQTKIGAVLETVQNTAELEAMLVNAIRCIAKQGGGNVDLVAHSTSDEQVLAFGSWNINANDTLKRFCQRVRSALGSTPITGVSGASGVSVRLIGCGTAGTKQGKKALKMMEEELKLPVYGTSTLVMTKHFSPDGYDGDFLVRGGTSQRQPALASEVLWRLPDDLSINPPPPGDFLPTREDPVLLNFVKRVFGALESIVDLQHAFAAPGLLLRPLTSVVLPAAEPSLERTPSGQQSWLLRADVLFDTRLLRLWPLNGGEGVIYPIRDRVALLAQLRDLGGWFRPAG